MTQSSFRSVAGEHRPARIVIGPANAHGCRSARPSGELALRTAVLLGPPRSGKSLFARWFAENGGGHRRRAHASRDRAVPPLESRAGRRHAAAHRRRRAAVDIALPDLRSASAPSPSRDRRSRRSDGRGLASGSCRASRAALGAEATDYLVPRGRPLVRRSRRSSSPRSTGSALNARSRPPTLYGAALEAVHGPDEPRLL